MSEWPGLHCNVESNGLCLAIGINISTLALIGQFFSVQPIAYFSLVKFSGQYATYFSLVSY